MFDLFPLPIIQAPMAGGTSGPRLAAAVSEAGALGFLAAGYKTAEAMRREIAALRQLTGRPFGVNLFAPQPETPAASDPAASDPAASDLARYRERLAAEAARYGAELGTDAGRDPDDGFTEKVAALLDDPVPVVGFAFGCPPRQVLEAFARAGTRTIVTATTAAEAAEAEAAGASAVCAQGVEAGGHQSTYRNLPERDAAGLGLEALLPAVREAVRVPVVAAGGIMRGGQIAAHLAAGASAAQLGTAFLACPESGAHPLHKQALTDPRFTRTELTRAFTGRPARGLVNRFMSEHGRYAPAAYPQVHYLTAGLRKAAAAAGDPQGMALWAGRGHRLARAVPAADLVGLLAAELDTARSAAAS